MLVKLVARGIIFNGELAKEDKMLMREVMVDMEKVKVEMEKMGEENLMMIEESVLNKILIMTTKFRIKI